jgi:hypothetical protein
MGLINEDRKQPHDKSDTDGEVCRSEEQNLIRPCPDCYQDKGQEYQIPEQCKDQSKRQQGPWHGFEPTHGDIQFIFQLQDFQPFRQQHVRPAVSRQLPGPGVLKTKDLPAVGTFGHELLNIDIISFNEMIACRAVEQVVFPDFEVEYITPIVMQLKHLLLV